MFAQEFKDKGIRAKDSYASMIACPVDVYVYSSEGELVGRILNNEVDESKPLVDGMEFVVMDDVKKLTLPAADEYRIEIVPAAEGDLTIVTAVKNANGDIEQKDMYSELSLTKTNSYFLLCTIENEELCYKLYDTDAQTVIGANLDNSVIDICFEVNGNGSVNGGGSFHLNEYVSVQAEAIGEDTFLGWYLGDTLVSTELTYSFFATQSQTYTAKFTDRDSGKGAALEAPVDPMWDGSEMVWTKPAIEPAYLSHYEVMVYYGATEQEALAMTNNVMAYNVKWGETFYALNVSMLQQWGEGYYHFKVRAVSSDPKFKQDSAWAEGYAALHYTDPNTTLPAPTGLTWTGTSISWDWPETQPAAFDYYTVGMYYGKTEAEARKKENCVFLYIENEENIISLNAEHIEQYGNGIYMFCVTAISRDAAAMSDSPGVWSEPLVYTKPSALKAPERAFWSDLTMDWTRPDIVPDYLTTYHVNLYYGKTEEEALAKTTLAAAFRFPLDSYVYPLTSLYVYQQYGDGYYHFQVRYGSSDLTKVFSSDWVEAETVLHYITPSESAAPYDLQWHIDHIDEDGYITQTPGMLFWKCAPEQTKFRVTVMKYGEEYNELVFEKDIVFDSSGSAEWRVADDLLFCDLQSGQYIFTVQALGDGESIADSTVSLSSYWSYTAPEEQLGMATNISWNDGKMQWTMTESDYLHGSEYEVYFAGTLEQTSVCIASGKILDSVASVDIQDFVEKHGSAGYYAFRVRAGSNDITKVRPGEWSEMSQYYSPENGFGIPSKAQIISAALVDEEITTIITVENGVKATAICAIYDKYGKMLGIEQAILDVGTNSLSFFNELPEGAYRAKIFAIEETGIPLCEMESLRLIALSDGSGSAEGEVPPPIMGRLMRT